MKANKKINNYEVGHISNLKARETSGINHEKFEVHNSSLHLDDPVLVQDILIQCFMDGEHEAFFEILSLYMDLVGKTKLSRETKIPERTIYNFIGGHHKTSTENIFKVMRFLSGEVDKKLAS